MTNFLDTVAYGFCNFVITNAPQTNDYLQIDGHQNQRHGDDLERDESAGEHQHAGPDSVS